MTSVEFFRTRRPGPELSLENRVIDRLPDIFKTTRPSWIGGSVPLGAGVPDLIVATWSPEVVALAHLNLSTSEILAYLRGVTRARLDTISDRLRQPAKTISKALEQLGEYKVVTSRQSHYVLMPEWRSILPEIVTIEAKVSNWRRAVMQAARNTLFSHYSYIAIPENIALRIRCEREMTDSGVGIISVDADDEVRVLRKARKKIPKAWTYYYQLAEILANNIKENN